MSDDTLWEAREAVFRPSYASTWANCAGALLPSRHAPDTAGYDAAVGTVFHWLIAEWQQHGRPDHWINNVLVVEQADTDVTFKVTCDQEMFDYAEHCLDRYAEIPGDRYIETFVDISSVTPIPKQGGTADLAICSPGELDIIDWKYGRGVQVFAEKNLQILLYAWGFFCMYDHKYEFQTIRLHIAQPRLNHFDLWTISRDELTEWADWLRVRARQAWKRNAPRSVSPKACQWCKIRTTCAALEAAREELADLTFDAIEEPVTITTQKAIVASNTVPVRKLPPAVELKTEQLTQIAKYAPLFEAWFKDVRTELVVRGIDGEDIGPDWKIVEGRSRRKWKNEKRAAAELMLLGIPERDLYERKLVSPNQSEKLLRHVGVGGSLMKEYLKTLVDRPPGRPSLAPAGDNRLALPPVDDVFDAEDDEL